VNGLLKLFITLQQGVVAGHEHAESFSSVPAGHHVSAPAGAYETVIVVLGVAITALVAFLTVKYFVRPGEKGAEHIKRRVLEAEGGEPV